VESHSPARPLPNLNELGRDLLHVSAGQKIFALGFPFLLFAAYFVLAAAGLWWAALLCPVLISFFTYGSVSHDLVHRNLRLPRWLNETLLTAIEMLTLRSGHAYRASHLNHHAHFPDDEDIEGASARMPLFRALLDGMTLQFRLWFWATRHATPQRGIILLEGIAAAALALASLLAMPWTPAPFIYVCLIVAGTWIFPIVTVVIPHNAHGVTELSQTRLFRGRVLSWIALEHLYHLEHHLYPQVPHQNWPKLAKRLDPYFQAEGLSPIKLLF